MPAEREEVVVGADSGDTEHGLPHLGRQQLGIGARGDPVPAGLAAGLATGFRTGGRFRTGGGEGGPVHLARGRQRQGVEHDPPPGHHVVRDAGVQALLDRGRAEGVRGRRRGAHREVADQPGVRSVAEHHDGRVHHRRFGAQGGLDLAEFDPVAAQLHLLVPAAPEFQGASPASGPEDPDGRQRARSPVR